MIFVTEPGQHSFNNFTDGKSFQFTQGYQELLENGEDDVVGGSSIDFTGKTIVDESFIRESTKLCASFVGVVGSQLCPYLMCQPLPAGLYTRWHLN